MKNGVENFKLQSKVSSLYKYANQYIFSNVPKVYANYRQKLDLELYELIHNVFRANLNSGNIRNKYQKEILVNVCTIDLLLTTFLELKIIEKKRFMAMTNMLLEIKKMIYGWIENEKLS